MRNHAWWKNGLAGRRREINGKCTHSDGTTAEEVRCGDVYVGVMMMHMVMMVVMMVSRIRTASRSRLLRLDRHRRACLSLSLPKPVSFHAANQNYHPVSSNSRKMLQHTIIIMKNYKI